MQCSIDQDHMWVGIYVAMDSCSMLINRRIFQQKTEGPYSCHLGFNDTLFPYLMLLC